MRKTIISGAGGELGFHITNRLTSNNEMVIALDKIFTSEQRAHFQETNTFYFELDLSEETEVDRFFRDFETQIGNVDTLINCAGLIHSEPIFSMFSAERMHSTTTWDNVIASNLKTTFLLSKHVIARMIAERTKGCIINISSISAKGNKGQTAYSAAKAGLEAMTKVWAAELGPMNIRVNAVAPGFINTKTTLAKLESSTISMKIQETPLNRLGNKNEVFQAIEFLRENSFITGEILNLNGGLRI